MDWAQNGAQFTSLSLRELIITLTRKWWAPSPSTLNPHSTRRDPQNQPDWRAGWGINHFKHYYRQQGQRTCNPPLQLQSVVAYIGTVLTRRKGYATTECGGSCCRLWLFHVQGTWDFSISLIHMFSVYYSPFPPLFLCKETDMKHQSTRLFLNKNWIIMWRFPKFFNLSTPTSFPVELRIPFSQLHMPFSQRIHELAFRRQLSQTYSKQTASCKPAIRLNVSTIKNI